MGSHWRPGWTLCSIWLAATLAGAAELPAGFRLEPVISGLTEPSALVSVPDGRILITERTTGNVRVIFDGELLASPLCTVSVTSTGEAGLLGVAVHPQFLKNKYIYLYYTAAGGQNKVSRYVVTGNSCSFSADMVASLGVGASGLRNGGGMAFGPDGKLYVATGDVEDSSNGQNDATQKAKILQVNVDATPVTVTNYGKGIRNGRGLDVGSAGNVYMTDGGQDPTIYDELNYVRSGANLGWDLRTGPTGGAYDDPLAYWSPINDASGVAVFGATGLFPDKRTDGLDNDHDKWGADRFPGAYRVDDNAKGECKSSAHPNQACTTVADCGPADSTSCPGYIETISCEMRDDKAEYCPGGVPYGDDACGAGSATHPDAGVDEPDESFVNNIFFAAGATNSIMRAVLKPADLTKLQQDTSTFLDSSALADCPDHWVDVMAGRDGWLYALARNSGGATGGLYRVIYDDHPGPREVSPDKTYFPLRVDKGTLANDVVVYWEDLRSDATQPRENGTDPAAPVREYTVWQGTLGTYYSHNPVAGLNATEGTAVNDALRKASFNAGSTNAYFLVSARHANLEGSVGTRSNGTQRPGYAVTDLCNTIGYYDSDWSLWKCGRDFTLMDQYGEVHSLSEYREKVVVLDFSAIWCPVCNTEANTIETDLWQPYRDRGVQVLTVLMDEDSNICQWSGRPTQGECRNWMDRSGTNPDHTFPCWVDPNPSASQQAWPHYRGGGGLPANVILDTGLRVVYAAGGTYSKTTIQTKLNLLVGAADACLQ